MSGHGYVLDAWARRSADGLLISGGAPSRLLRLTPRGRDAVTAALAGSSSGDPAVRRLLKTMLDAGLLHPSGVPASAARVPITIVVPTRNGAPWLRPLIAALHGRGEVVVVDDGSTDGSRELAAAAGALVLVNQQAPGQSGARNTGLLAATTELVAFVDQDCLVTDRWLDHLVGLFDDDSLALAAPRVRSVPGASRLAQYERHCSPLDLGADPSLVEPGRRITYVPSAAVVTRRSALLEVGGFDPELRVGEDVDLVWRLVKAGWRVRYSPESEVHHHPRATLLGLALQRFRYGSSAPVLESRHPGAATPLHVGTHVTGIWLGGVALGPWAALAGLAASTLSGAAKGSHPQDRAEIAAIVLRGHLRATRYLARVLVREWLPLTILASVWSRRARRVAIAAFALDGVASRHTTGGPPLATHFALRGLDLAAYAAGLWHGVIRARSLEALRVRRLPPDKPRHSRR